MYCKNCGAVMRDGASFCSACGSTAARVNVNAAICAKCGSNNIDIQLFKEDRGSKTVTMTKTTNKEKGHGFLWWILIGWWWWVVDLFLWCFLFPIRLVAQLTKKKKYVGREKSVSTTNNQIAYRTICLCKNCGNTWQK